MFYFSLFILIFCSTTTSCMFLQQQCSCMKASILFLAGAYIKWLIKFAKTLLVGWITYVLMSTSKKVITVKFNCLDEKDGTILVYVLLYITVEDRMFLEMQDFNFDQIKLNLPKSNHFSKYNSTFPNFASKFPKYHQS